MCPRRSRLPQFRSSRGESTDRMPVDACRYYYHCENCHAVLKSKAGDCCVYCSYGSVRCPPAQLGGTCSSSES
ncbi:MAG TPA: GDCCVxC domain-containing (seleno)protein [Woeseiaceae bacterium]|nr:GDCCVxC domain-containing (seleno)protein [Woeseiaceae bacterium]